MYSKKNYNSTNIHFKMQKVDKCLIQMYTFTLKINIKQQHKMKSNIQEALWPYSLYGK